MELDAEQMRAKILLIGESNSRLSIMLEALLREHLDQYGVVSTGFDPVEKVDPRVLVVLDQAGHEEVEELVPKTPGQVIDEQLRLVVYLGEEVEQQAPVISVNCPKITLSGEEWPGRDRDRSVKQLADVYRSLRDQTVPHLLDQLPEAAD